MKPRSQLIMWASILLALFMILLDKLHNSPTVTSHQENFAQSDQRKIDLAGILSEPNQFGGIEKLHEELPINVESETLKPPVLDVNAPVSMDIYVVQENDTLGEIAQRYNLDIDSLLHVNKLQNPDKIHYGQQLRIPLQRDISHIVKENDTLESIAHQYSVSLKSIVDANAIRNEDLIHPGAKLRIPGAKLPKKP